MTGLGHTLTRTARFRTARGVRRDISPFDIVAALVTLAAVALVVYPLASTLFGVVVVDGRIDLGAFGRTFALPGIGSVLRDTAIVVGASVLLALVTAVGMAWAMERTNARLGFVGTVLPLLPLVIPSLAGTVGWVSLTSPGSGVINVYLRRFLGIFGVHLQDGPLDLYSYYGVIFLYTLYLVPFGYVVISAALRNTDPALEEAARVNGASLFRVFRTVTLPSIRPAIAGAATVQLIIGFAMFSIPMTVGVQAHIEILSVRIYRLLTFSFPPKTPEAIVLSLLMLACVVCAILVQRRTMRNQRYSTIGGRLGRSSLVNLGRGRWVARALVLGYVACTSIVPLAGLVLLSIQRYWSANPRADQFTLDNFRSVLSLPELRESLLNSVGFGIQGGLLVMAAATIVALYLSRRAGARAKVVNGVVRLPATIPHLVVAVAFIAAFAGPPFRLSGTPIILVAAYFVMYLPQAVVFATTAVSQVGHDLSEASRISGAGPGRTFLRVVLPLMWPGFVGGFAVCFVVIAGEVSGSPILAGINTPVIGFTMVNLWTKGSLTSLAALSTIVSLVFFVVTIASMAMGRARRTIAS